MAYLSSAFDTTYNMNNLPQRQVRIDPRPDSTKTNEQSDYFKTQKAPISINYPMIQISSKLGALRPMGKGQFNNKDLKYNQLMNKFDSKPLKNYMPKYNVVEPELYGNVRPAFKDFDDWLVLGIIIISVGLFMRFKDKL